MNQRMAIIVTCAWLAWLGELSPNAVGVQGGGKADYDRAASIPRQVRGKVTNERLDVQWVNDTSFIYRLETAPNAARFLRVNAVTVVREDAFDHDAVADALSRTLGRAVSPDALPIERIIAEEDDLLFFIRGDTRVFRLGEDDLEEVPLDADSAMSLRPTRATRSGNNGQETEVLFVNRLDEPVTLFWLDQSGDRREYATVQPGGEHRQHTFANHVWSVEKADGEVVARFRATARPAAAIISDTMPSPVDRPGRRGRGTAGGGDGQPAVRTHQLFIRDHNAWLRNIETRAETPLTTDGAASDSYTMRHWWSPDNTRLVVMRIKPAQRHTVYMVESSPDDQVQPKLHEHQYLKPGDEIDHPRLVLFDIERMEAIRIDDGLFPNPWSINDVAWKPDGSTFSFRYVQRGHEVVRVLSVDANSGSVTTIIDETTETFIDYSQKTCFRRMNESDEIIWMSERSGWNHLYLIDGSTGKVKNAITSGEWVVRSVEDVNEESRTIRFRAMGVYPDQDPYHVHYGRVKFDGTGLTWLTEGDGTHTIEFSPNSEHYIDTYSRVDMPPVRELRRTSNGALVMALARADDSGLESTGWQRPERFVAKGRDGETDIWGVIFRPSNFDPSVKYPVIEQIYAGPHGHHVPKSFRAWHGAQSMAELGFVLVQIDGMGTNWRSKAFHDVCWKNIADAGFPDRIAWMKAAAANRPWMDLERVGIYGGSAGGQNALGAMLRHGDFYDAAAADCGCHDNRMDKIWWNEAWMGWPIGEHYEQQSNVTMAHKLQGDLLLIVGELDRNVDPASTMQVVDALIRADKDFELIVVPGGGHGAGGGAYGRRRQRDFFVRSLLGVEPRWDKE